jgi:hypothetical protein
MSKPNIRIHDLTTGEVIDRVMTDEEFTEWQTQQAETEAAIEAAAAKTAARTAVLAKLGLSAEEAAALLG